MPLVSTPAVILHVMPYGDTSKILRLLTRDLGLQSVIARGARRPRSPTGPRLDLFASGTASLRVRERRELSPLTGFESGDAHTALAHDVGRFSAASALADPADYANPNVVKVVVNAAGRALYFSRRTIPYVRDAAPGAEPLAAFPFLKHLGIYGYRRQTLLRLVAWPVSPLEQAEKLEQLRALENGVQIAVVRVNYDSVGVDVPADVPRVEKLLKNR